MGAISRLLLNSFDFSTTEQKTNLKWIDGKDIYVITTPYTSTGIGNLKIPIPTGYETVVDWMAITDIQGNSNCVNNYYWDTNNFLCVYTQNGYLGFSANGFGAISSGHLTLFYTKSS